ncbi:MAG: hypothetical protein IPP83_00790 [Flavobacteriales bacterium]|nr:hypothetical protein [Flavobacteriales bacterium]
MFRSLLLSIVLLPFIGTAQTPVRIVDPTMLVLKPDLGNTAAQAGMQAAGLNSEVMAKAQHNSTEDHWPIGLRTDSARMANRAALANYTAYLMCEYATDEGAFVLVSLPAIGNFHMPDDLRSVEDIHLVFRSGGVEVIDNIPAKARASKGPAWRGLPSAQILKADDVFATYDLSDDPEALVALEKQGLSKAEIEAVIFRSHERNWPDGIDSFQDRYPKLALFKKYKAYRLAHWGDKELLVIPVEANRKAPLGIRPYLDIYMVFSATAVKVKAKK